METLNINYVKGRMSVNVSEFFPCTQNKARKLFPLIRDYCSGDDRAELGAHLSYLVGYYRGKVAKGDYPRSTLKRAEGNYKLYCSMEVDDLWMT